MQLTGCDAATIDKLERILVASLQSKRAGALYRHSIRNMLIAVLIKLRSGSAYRTISIHLRIPFVTLFRITNLVCRILAHHSLGKPQDNEWFIVDTTCTRIRSTEQGDYSGYKHHKNRKIQVVIDDKRRVLAVSSSYPGKIHDKTIWNGEIGKIASILDRPTLADKAYAGAKGENLVLFRPFKRNEKAYRANAKECKSFNLNLSRARVTIEHVFAQLKTYRIIQDIFPLRPDKYATVVRAIALIHNVKLQTS